MEKNKAHVFQHKFTGLQMFVYHQTSEFSAKNKLSTIVLDANDWDFLGMKTATCA